MIRFIFKLIISEQKHMLEAGPDDDESEAELSDTEIERKREMLKQKILTKKEEDIMTKEEEKSDTDSEESSEYEEVTDSEEETGMQIMMLSIISNISSQSCN